MILSLIDRVKTGTFWQSKHSLTLFIWNVALVVCIAGISWTGGLTSGLPGTVCVIDTSDIIHYFDHDKWSSILQLIKGKSRDLQKLLKYLNGRTTSASNILLSSGVLPINFVLYWKD